MAETYQEEMENEENIEKVKKLMHDGCGCAFGAKGGPCSGQFSEADVLFNLNNCSELSNDELDLVILASIQAFTHRETSGTKRSRNPRCSFYFQSLPICKEMFLLFYGLSDSRFRRLKEHYQNHGVSLRTHGNTKRLPHNTLSQATIEEVKAFLSNYVEENAIFLPGRIPGFKSDEIKVLSSSETKKSMWRAYEVASEASHLQAVCYTKFLHLWEQFYPNVVVAKPMTDLCFTCQQNTTKLQRAANLSDSAKSECVKAHQEHLNCAQAERQFYRDSCLSSENTLETIGTETFLRSGSHEACSFNAKIHYSFDYTQQVHIPSNPFQPGPIYFKTPRKCGIFGVICEGLPRQVNFVIDEACSTGKGANPTISYVHHYFKKHGLGETDTHLNADNCAGQNKNNYFLWYLAWRTMMNLHHTITYSFLVAGHTKFAPDHCFGLIKEAYKVNYVSSLYEFARLVETSSSGVNKAQLVGTHDGRVIVPVYDWISFLGQYFKKLPNITKFHHFRFSKENPGMVFYREFVSSPEQSFMLLKTNVILPSPSLPNEINPDGLTEECNNYLYHEEKPGTEDLVAPVP